MLGLAIADGKLAPQQLPITSPAEGEVLLRVAYAGINRADLLQVEGSYAAPEGASPLPGLEVSGTIASLGAGVKDWQIGQHVCALLSGGGYAEYVVAPASQLLPIPENISLNDAASLPESLATSVMALVQVAHLQTGERVLVHGGTSGLGIYMVQVAKGLGAEVFATVGSDEKITFLKKFGVLGINHRASPFADQIMQATNGEGVDVIIDTLGAPQLANHLKILRKGGRMVTLAMLEGNVAESFKIAGFFLKQLSWSGATLRGRTLAQKAEIIATIRQQLWPHLLSGRIQPVVDSVFPLKDAENALKKMQERLHMGKILLEVSA